MEETKSYLNLFPACEVKCENVDGIEMIFSNDLEFQQDLMKSSYKNAKLILRPLASLTEEENEEYRQLTAKYFPRHKAVTERTLPSREQSAKWAAAQTRFYLSKGIDVFGLIEAGIAIDKTKL